MYSVSVTLNHLFTGLHCVVLTEWVCYWSKVNQDSLLILGFKVNAEKQTLCKYRHFRTTRFEIVSSATGFVNVIHIRLSEFPVANADLRLAEVI